MTPDAARTLCLLATAYVEGAILLVRWARHEALVKRCGGRR